MPNYCVCAGCRNSSLSGHRVHSFPDRTKNSDCFNAWLSFVQKRRRDFTAASVTRNAVVCSAHFRKEDYVPGDVMALRMGCRTQNRVRLIPVAVPSIHAADPGSAAGGSNRKTPGPSQPPPVLHCGSQRSLRPFHLSTGSVTLLLYH
uniref:THAP domain-containing protein 1 n=1 Tax=Lates calcarifer TaxID=8187 RepID=A0A4W6DT53_LATCA